jgi:transposase InsO family protein
MDTKFKVLRTSVAKSLTALTNICQSSDPLDLTELRTHIDSLVDKNNRLESHNDAYESSGVDKDDIAFEEQLERMEDYRDKVARALSVSKGLLTQANVPASVHMSSGLKLPKLTLPTFDGNVLNWHEFFESFNGAVHCKSISDVEKFSYLRQHLRDEALNTISGLALSGSNYQNAMDLLQLRYGDNKRRIRAHVRELINTEPPNFRDVKSLRKFVDRVRLHMRGLEVLHVASDDYEIFLCEILVSKVHFNAKREWAKLEEDKMNLESLLKIIEGEAKTLDIVDSTFNKRDVIVKQPTTREFERKHINSFPVTQSVSVCPLCNQSGHPVFRCAKLMNMNPQGRKDAVFAAGLCFTCLGKHFQRDCASKLRCKTCNGRHNTLLHGPSDQKGGGSVGSKYFQPSASGQTNVVSSSNATSSSFATNTAVCQSRSLLPIITVPFPCRSGVRYFKALLDSGSERSFVLNNVLSEIDYDFVERRQLSIFGFGGKSTSDKFNVVSVILNGSIVCFICTDKLCVINNFQSIDVPYVLAQNGLSACELSDQDNVSVLIGVDYFYRFMTGNVRRLSHGLVALESVYGWTVQGQLDDAESVAANLCQLCDTDLRAFWETELSSIVPSEQPSERKVLEQTWSRMTKVDGRYYVGFPWIDHVGISGSYYVEARMRLLQTLRKLSRTGRLQDYHKIFQVYLEENIIERVSSCSEDKVCRYLPHHPVIKEDKATTKLRIVFNASAKGTDERSLNDCMVEGENLFPSIVGILLRFRQYLLGVTSDVRMAFLMVGLVENDRDFVRFLWFDDLSDVWSTNPTTFRFTRIPFGAKASPFLLSSVIQYQLNACAGDYPDTIARIKDNVYVDNLIVSVPTLEVLVAVSSESRSIFEDMRMDLRQWRSNDMQVLKAFDVSEREEISILGLVWHSQTDTLGVQFKCPAEPVRTKHLAAVTCSLFDPLGFFAPFTLLFKFLLRRAWDSKTDWDRPLTPDITVETAALLVHFETINNMQLPRWLNYSPEVTFELHGFGDASTVAYGSVVYLRVFVGEKSYSQFVVSKTRLCPSNKLTVPRLELLAALTNARLLVTVKTDMRLSCPVVFAWSDSNVCLAWIRATTKCFKEFVENRVKEIRQLVDINQWQYIATDSNPADYLTKPFPVKKWLTSELWWHGPELLRDSAPPVSLASTEVDLITETAPEEIVCNVNTATFEVIDVERFSNFNRLRASVAYVLRFIHNCRAARWHGALSVEELTQAEVILLKQCQRSTYHEEFNLLTDSLEVPARSSLYILEPFLDEKGIIRSKGRLNEAVGLTYDEQHPIILPRKSSITRLIVNQTHLSLLHADVSTLMHRLRDKYWIMQARRCVKGVLSKCRTCKRYKAKACQERFATLPFDRCNEELRRPFQSTGIDYFGPILSCVSHQKFYVLLFTCMNVRAVHLEVTASLDTKDFMLAFERFASRRGVPRLMRSDNAKTFKCASSILAQRHQIQWKFSTERAPWTGGAWERMVRSVKTALKFTFKHGIVSTVDLSTYLCKVEHIVNSRPITSVNDDDGSTRPIAPLDFLRTSIISSKSEHVADREQLLRSILNNNRTILLFWNRWRREYLRTLLPNKSLRAGIRLEIGDVVLLNEGPKRQFWPLCRVIERYPDRYGVCRKVKLLCRGKFVTRATRLLYNLEVK